MAEENSIVIDAEADLQGLIQQVTQLGEQLKWLSSLMEDNGEQDTDRYAKLQGDIAECERQAEEFKKALDGLKDTSPLEAQKEALEEYQQLLQEQSDKFDAANDTAKLDEVNEKLVLVEQQLQAVNRALADQTAQSRQAAQEMQSAATVATTAWGEYRASLRGSTGDARAMRMAIIPISSAASKVAHETGSVFAGMTSTMLGSFQQIAFQFTRLGMAMKAAIPFAAIVASIEALMQYVKHTFDELDRRLVQLAEDNARALQESAKKGRGLVELEQQFKKDARDYAFKQELDSLDDYIARLTLVETEMYKAQEDMNKYYDRLKGRSEWSELDKRMYDEAYSRAKEMQGLLDQIKQEELGRREVLARRGEAFSGQMDAYYEREDWGMLINSIEALADYGDNGETQAYIKEQLDAIKDMRESALQFIQRLDGKEGLTEEHLSKMEEAFRNLQKYDQQINELETLYNKYGETEEGDEGEYRPEIDTDELRRLGIGIDAAGENIAAETLDVNRKMLAELKRIADNGAEQTAVFA